MIATVSIHQVPTHKGLLGTRTMMPSNPDTVYQMIRSAKAHAKLYHISTRSANAHEYLWCSLLLRFVTFFFCKQDSNQLFKGDGLFKSINRVNSRDFVPCRLSPEPVSRLRVLLGAMEFSMCLM